jgi:mRNA interferase HigB
MDVLNETLIRAFQKRHPNSRKPLNNWLDVITRCSFSDFASLRKTFPSADYAVGYNIFNIGGNNYRLISTINYGKQQVLVNFVFTHNEYNRWSP